jgi:hypothetical protein
VIGSRSKELWRRVGVVESIFEVRVAEGFVRGMGWWL